MSDQIQAAAVIYAKNLTPMSEFYAAVLGPASIRRADDHVVLVSATFQLVILAIPAPIAQTIDITDPPARRSQAAVKLAFPVTSIASLRAAASNLGGQIDSVDREWHFQGDLVCDGHDPEGNVLQLRQRAGNPG